MLSLILATIVLIVTSNIITTALELPWYTRPVSILRWVCVDLASNVAAWMGQILAHIYAELARRLTTLLERLWPAVKDTLVDVGAVLTAGDSVVRAFFRSWAETLLEYRAVQFLIDPTTLFWMGCLAVAALVIYLCVRAGLHDKFETWLQTFVPPDNKEQQPQPVTPRGQRAGTYKPTAQHVLA